MSEKTVVLSVDDEQFFQEVIREALEPAFEVICASNGREALELLAARAPAVVILDVDMPEMNGYEVCRQIRSDADHADLPVLFLSGKDRIEDQLAGLEAGGDDYLTKPFHLDLLLTRIRNLAQLAEQRKCLRDSLRYATGTAMTAMTAMSEMGLLLEGIKSFNVSNTFEVLAAAIVAALARFDLLGIVQIRHDGGSVSETGRGAASPLEISVISQMASMDRIIHRKSHMVINYPMVTLLVTNMPEDEELAGRLRDHLAMLAEAAEARVQGIVHAQEANRRGLAIAAMIDRITKTLDQIDTAQRDARAATSVAISVAINTSEKAMMSMALTEAQEKYVAKTILEGLEHVADVQASSIDVQNHLSGLIEELKAVL